MSTTAILIVAALALLTIAYLVQNRIATDRRQAVSKQVAQIQGGCLPTIAAPLGVKLTKGEVVHAAAAANGVRSDNDRKLGDGTLVVSNRRIRFVGKTNANLPWSKIETAGASNDTVVVYMSDGRGYEFVLRYRTDAELLDEVMNAIEVGRKSPTWKR